MLGVVEASQLALYRRNFPLQGWLVVTRLGRASSGDWESFLNLRKPMLLVMFEWEEFLNC